MFPTKRKGLVERDVEGEKIIFSYEDSKIHQLNPSAMFIWEQCDGKKTEAEIVEALTDYFSISPDLAKVDVASTLRQLLELKLIEMAE